jgi:dihydrofolate synthase/folylpolyglutamate synthase
VRWPGRLESITTGKGGAQGDGEVLLDAAHNPDGAEALARALGARSADPAKTALLFGAMADKDYAKMLDFLAPFAAHRVYVLPQGRKAAAHEALGAVLAGRQAGSVSQGLKEARRLVGPDGLVVVAGSIFLVGEARAHLLGLPSDPAVAL